MIDLRGAAKQNSLMPTIACPHCRQPTVVAVQGQSRCAHCGGAIAIGFPVVPPPLPVAPQILVVNTERPDRPWPLSRSRRNTAKGVNRAMLLATGAWLVCMALTLCWYVVAAVTDEQLAQNIQPGARVLGAIIGSFCLWFFETLAYGVAMIVLWVIRENVRD